MTRNLQLNFLFFWVNHGKSLLFFQLDLLNKAQVSTCFTHVEMIRWEPRQLQAIRSLIPGLPLQHFLFTAAFIW